MAVQFVGRGYFSILSFTFSTDMELRNLLLARFANDSATGGAVISGHGGLCLVRLED